MPLKYRMDSGRQRLITTAEGDVHLADVVDHLTKEREDRLLSHPEFVDATSATSRLSANDIRAIVGVLHKLSSEHNLGPTAVVVPSDVAYGMMRMLGILVEEFCRIGVFRSANEAEEWLDQLQARP